MRLRGVHYDVGIKSVAVELTRDSLSRSDASREVELIAREQIRELVATYAHAADSGRFDELVALILKDVTKGEWVPLDARGEPLGPQLPRTIKSDERDEK